MAHEDQFTAKGPPFSGSGHPFTGFSTRSADLHHHGANFQGKHVGVYAECVHPAGPTDREPSLPGVGVWAVGGNFGIVGEILTQGDNRGIAGVHGQHNRGGAGTVGAVIRGGTGVAGLSLASINPAQIAQALAGAAIRGTGTGVLGRSGSGKGVHGTSNSSAGIHGESETGKGVHGTSGRSTGVHGQSESGIGVIGECPIGAGVFGMSPDGVGVFGRSERVTGVRGESAEGIGVWGKSDTSVAVRGESPSDVGVEGKSRTGVGVRGESQSLSGVVGLSASGRGGEFGSTGLAVSQAQIRLVPQVMPVPGVVPSAPMQYDAATVHTLPRDGQGGDLLVTTEESGNCTLWFCARSQEGGRPAVWRQVLLGSPIGAEESVEVLWPQQVLAAESANAANVLFGPNGTMCSIFPGSRATFGTFVGRTYPDLPALLRTRPPVTHGDVVDAAALARSDVIAFERNGGSPDTGGGWESCDWTFTDGVAQVFVAWNGLAGAVRDPHVVANGSIRGADYVRCFAADAAPGYDPIADEEVVSFILFSLPELRVHNGRFAITVSGSTSSSPGQATPDIDSIGILRLIP